jgi:hypothetical protein
MKPKKIKSFIKEVAEELKEDPEFVEDLFYEYWRAVRKSLQNLEVPQITVDGLGRFKIRKKNLLKNKKHCEDVLNAMNMTFDNHHSRKELENRLILIKHVSDIIEQDDQAKNQKRKERNERKKNMGK